MNTSSRAINFGWSSFHFEKHAVNYVATIKGLNKLFSPLAFIGSNIISWCLLMT
ncbi:hypothetical protein ACJX0J_027132, partial [Zea mays]